MEQQNVQKKKSHAKYYTIAVIALLVLAFYLFSGKKNGLVDIDDDAILGNVDAKATIIEFSDYQCPYCRKFWAETYQEIKKEYVETGKARIVFRDFPILEAHPSSFIAAEASECVREKGGDSAYYKMHDKIFSEQNIMDSGNALGEVTKTIPFTKADLNKWAKESGYEISECLDSGKYKDEISKDLREGKAAGVKGTPSFFVNGKLIEGAKPFSDFKKEIEKVL